MTNKINIVLGVIASFLFSAVAGTTDFEYVHIHNQDIQLYHSLDIDHPDIFTPRGNISMGSINSASLSINQNILTSQESIGLSKLAAKGKFYRIKAIVVADGTKKTFLTSSKACSVVISQLLDVFVISLDHAGNVISVFYKPNQDSGSSCEDIAPFELSKFSTEVSLMNVESAPIPDTTTFIQKMDRERESKERGEQQDNRSFLSKYWVYIVPCVILLLLSSASQKE